MIKIESSLDKIRKLAEKDIASAAYEVKSSF
jgi:hypothetical protein